jgi:hypothetical protein
MNTSKFQQLLLSSNFEPHYNPKTKTPPGCITWGKAKGTKLWFTPVSISMETILNRIGKRTIKEADLALQANGIALTDMDKFCDILVETNNAAKAHVNRLCLQGKLGYIPFICRNDEARLVMKTIHKQLSAAQQPLTMRLKF